MITHFAPFYEENFYNAALIIRNKCFEQGNTFRMFGNGETLKLSENKYKEIYDVFPNELDNLEESLQQDIRNYLKSLRTLDCLHRLFFYTSILKEAIPEKIFLFCLTKVGGVNWKARCYNIFSHRVPLGPSLFGFYFRTERRHMNGKEGLIR